MKVIPKKQRIKVYKRALEVIENDLFLIELGLESNVGLCMLLDCIMFNTHYKIRRMEWVNTPKRFPEFKKYMNYNKSHCFIRFENLYEENSKLWRRVVLRLILEELKANEEY